MVVEFTKGKQLFSKKCKPLRRLVIPLFSKYIQSIIYKIQQPLNIISIGSTQKYAFKNAYTQSGNLCR